MPVPRGSRLPRRGCHVSGAYGTSTTSGIKPQRGRSSRLQMIAMDYELWSLAEADSRHGEHPVTLRQVYYRAVARGLVAKDTKETKNANYRKVCRHLGNMRERGELPWSWLADNARVRRQLTQHAGLTDALASWQRTYRRAYWGQQRLRVEVWVESDAIASALWPSIAHYGVPVYTCRGQASKTFIQAAAEDSARLAKPICILYAGDWDPTGLAIDRSLEERYHRYSDEGADISIGRVAVTPLQIQAHGLTGGPAKVGDPNYKRFRAKCEELGLPVVAIEAEELPPDVLRESVARAVESLIDADAWNAVIAYEEAERQQLEALVSSVERGEHLS